MPALIAHWRGNARTVVEMRFLRCRAVGCRWLDNIPSAADKGGLRAHVGTIRGRGRLGPESEVKGVQPTTRGRVPAEWKTGLATGTARALTGGGEPSGRLSGRPHHIQVGQGSVGRRAEGLPRPRSAGSNAGKSLKRVGNYDSGVACSGAKARQHMGVGRPSTDSEQLWGGEGRGCEPRRRCFGRSTAQRRLPLTSPTTRGARRRRGTASAGTGYIIDANAGSAGADVHDKDGAGIDAGPDAVGNRTRSLQSCFIGWRRRLWPEPSIHASPLRT